MPGLGRPGELVDVSEPEDPAPSAPPAVRDLAGKDAHAKLGSGQAPSSASVTACVIAAVTAAGRLVAVALEFIEPTQHCTHR